MSWDLYTAPDCAAGPRFAGFVSCSEQSKISWTNKGGLHTAVYEYEAIESSDYADRCSRLRDPVARARILARNLSELARRTGMTRAGLYRALSEGGNPSFATIHKVATALGLKITFESLEQTSA
ncbi:addiction module antidote protein [Actinomycetaceae bacterium MB13-C1-2]|nr:addiction module antidote protein [Actinomycetaceae bacterium MB13-C1-2]